MMEAVIRFGIIFLFIAIGFSASFHILYDNMLVYQTWSGASISTAISIFYGYSIPPYYNILSFPAAWVGYVFQVLLLIIGVVLLLNFLIAMMNSVYQEIVDKSEEEYRRQNARKLTQMGYTPWPIPLNIIQAVLCPAVLCTGDDDDGKIPLCPLSCCKNPEVDKIYISDQNTKKLLYNNMVVGYFRETMTESKYEKATLLFSAWGSDDEDDSHVEKMIQKIQDYSKKSPTGRRKSLHLRKTMDRNRILTTTTPKHPNGL